MGWKAVESEEYESSAPAVQAHFHAVRAEEALRRDDYVQAEKEGHLASEKFLQAAQRVSDKRTIDALVLLAENYEYRSKVARTRNPRPVEAEEEKVRVDGGRHRADERERSAEQPEIRTETPDPEGAQKTETQLNVAAAEMEELWRRLNEIGLSSPGSADKNLLMSSRHLSSSLGDSFCLLPAKTRTTIGVVATAVDGGSTLRAAVASRMRNQRQRLMEQQLGGRLDPRRSGGTSTNGNGSATSRYQDGRGSSGDGDDSGGQGDFVGLQETVAHQKMEIVRLLNTVKTLSSENTKLVKKCEALTNIQAENREIRDSMDLFKKDYNQKLVMIKRALEEWRRQRNNGTLPSPQPSTTTGGNSALESKLKMQEEQIAKLMEEARLKDDRIAKYDKWYKTLKAGAKAKQLSQSRDGGNVASSFSSSSFVPNGGGPSNSFTNSSSFHAYSPGSEESTGSSATSSSRQFSRPPAHPNRRAL
ncbi:hypothetical protein GN244_ATG08846 [Phytophthora infestans]|uniref:Uncharacterized protein n=1 Tax=Phytophthora infestans TaxID=4787 RepID=A0A833T3Y3_PHYIN|nr:hypothetical protein GN244_ATG08846 [Phytophthora infestans]KAF4143547.1 hypothetical protein GN958_ATG07280 [Phytophthora infestans]